MINKQKYKVFLKDLFWHLYGLKITYAIDTKMPKNIKNILFVCKGNVCRSVLAEAIARKIASDQGLTNITFISGGLEVSKKNPAEEHAISVARENGLDLTNHYSKPITREMIDQSDVILVVEYNHLKAIEKRFTPHLIMPHPVGFGTKRIKSHRACPSGRGTGFTGIDEKVMLLPLFCDGFRWGYERFNIKDPYGKPVDEFRHCYNHIFDSLRGFLEKLKSNILQKVIRNQTKVVEH